MFLSIYNKKVLIYCVALLFSLQCFAYKAERYLYYTEIDGLPRNQTTCIEQDQYGYLWIGTANGIARYDGKNFNIYKELSGIGVIELFYDSRHTLWVCTSKGLFKYNRITNFFELIVNGYISKVQEDNGEIYYLLLSNIFKLSNITSINIYQGDNLTDFCFSKEGIWISKMDHGVRLLSRESDFKKITFSTLNNKSVSLISMIDDILFICCYNGQVFALMENREINEIKINNHYFILKVVKVGQEIWMASDGNGIIILDKNLKILKTLSRNTYSSSSINSNSIYDIFPGNSNEIWIATYGAGLTCILPDNLLFLNIVPEKGNPNSLIANEGTSVYIKEPYFYFGTNYGLSSWDINTGEFKNLSSDKLRMELNGTKITAIHASQNNHLWIGTYDGLLGKYTLDYNLIKAYYPNSNAPDEMQRIVYLQEIDNNHMLILTQFQNQILLNFNIITEKPEVFELYQKGSRITYFLLNSIRENQQGELLALISDKGLFHINWVNNVLENRLEAMNNRINFYASDFYQDKKGNYWFATAADGLLRLSEDGKNYKKWTLKEGLPTNTLIKIESVDDQYIWISSISGICRFNMQNEEILNFNYSDGLPANEFQDRVSAKTQDGKIIFGSVAGFTIIDPLKYTPDTSKSEVIISDISFQNQSIRSPEGKQLLKKPLEETKEIWLPYNKNSFSIHFFVKAKSYIKHPNYAYRLIGLENEINNIGEANYATYTNLSPGTYIFEIKSADKFRESIPTQLIIHIKSPWYLSWYSYIAYSILFFTIIFLSVYAYLKRMELKKEKEISDFKIQKEHELTENKLAFFTNISHDLKTPLTLIDAPVNDLLRSDNLTKNQVDKLLTINRNSKRLYKLISDLLDFRKITQKQYNLKVKETSVNDIINDILNAFKEECSNKSIQFECSVKDNLIGFIDAEKIEKILWNLISNAIKFSDKEGLIEIKAEDFITNRQKYMQFIISDKGIGISEDDKKKIFDRFFKAENSKLLNKGGTGIGLSIVQELVELHHGSIQVESKLSSGTSFTVTIPSEKKYYSENELAEISLPFYEKQANIDNNILEIEKQPDIKQKHYNLHSLLIVEDNAELREYLAGHFNKKLKVYQAEDGFKGLIMAKEHNPDIIITDVQMPKMDGYEFVKEIRQHFDTSHIPVIMLTAYNTINQQIEGLSTGADVYLTKPFDINILDAQLVSLIENRKTLRNKFKGIESLENIENSLPQKDVEFIFELKLFIEENIMHQDLNVAMLSDHFAVSLAQLHRKIKSLTGSTPNNLIKSIRLKKAYKLIREDGLRVSEAAYQTGFSDPNYFALCFKKEFGENPSQIGLH
ncbi:MAG: response regulator [Bacteroidales bacterium]|nr:response regulator [Bacteroidales bacterium]